MSGSGTEADINAALIGAGAEAVLCPYAFFALRNPIKFTAPNQRLYTQGLPTDDRRAVVQIANSSLTNAIWGVDQSGISIQTVIVDGDRRLLGFKQPDGQCGDPQGRTCWALIVIGGDASNQQVQSVAAYDTRSWSTLQIFEGTVIGDVPGCQNATIADNTIGPAGTPEELLWADGRDLARMR